MLKKTMNKVLARAAEMHFRNGVEEAFERWVSAIDSAVAERVVALYAEDAILNATLNPTPMQSQTERLGYFQALAARPGIRVIITSRHLRMFGDSIAVISGLYRFEFYQDGQHAKLPARYSFVYQRTPAGWVIIDHHSSCLPDAPTNSPSV